MTVCALVLAHSNPKHVGRNTEAWVASGNSVVLHVDGRVDDEPFRREIAGGTVVVDDPTHVYWGGFSIVDAMLKLFRSGLHHFPHADYFAVVSGDSYPIACPSAIDVYLRNSEAEFVNLLPMPSSEVEKPLSRLSHYYIEHDPRTSIISPLYKAAHLLMRRPYKHMLKGMRPFCGSQWITVSREAAEWLMKEVDARPEYVTFCRNTRIPDEHFFQILLGNSPFAGRLRPGAMYADFNRPAGPRPAALDATHVEHWRSNNVRNVSPYGLHRWLFARKFTDESRGLLEMVRDRVWRIPIEYTP